MALFLIAAATLVFASERTYNMRNVLLSDKYYQFKERVTRIESLEESLEDLVKDRDQKIAYINNEKRRIIEEYAGKWPESAGFPDPRLPALAAFRGDRRPHRG